MEGAEKNERGQSRHCDNLWCPDHMKGWEAFGVTNEPEGVTVRRLGFGHHSKNPTYGTDKWGPGETKRGVHEVTVQTFADSPASAFLAVLGSTEQAVRETWYRAAEAYLIFARAAWPAGVVR